MSFLPWADAWRRFSGVPQGRRAVCSDIPAASAAWGIDAPKARATIKVVRLRCLGMAVCGRFSPFQPVFGRLRPVWPNSACRSGPFSDFAAFRLFWRGRGAPHRDRPRPLTAARGHRILGGGVDCPSGAQSGAPIDKLRTLCQAPAGCRDPRRAGAVACVPTPRSPRKAGSPGAIPPKIYSYLSMYNSS